MNTVDTIKGGVKAVGKLIEGDPKGALKEVKKTPLYKEGENLVKNVKQVGEGIVKGDIKKVGEGLLGVATNDLLGFIPGQKALGVGAKAIKGGIKNTVESATKKGAKKETKETKTDKDNVIDKSFKDKKAEEKAKEDKKKKQCDAKKKRSRRATGSDKKSDDGCDDDDKDLKCPRPRYAEADRFNVILSSFHECANAEIGEKCNYLCNAGYNEKPDALWCRNSGKKDKNGKKETIWTAKNVSTTPVDASCQAQACYSDGFIFVESSTVKSVLDKRNKNEQSKYDDEDLAGDSIFTNRDVILYLVKYDEDKKIPIYSVAYHRWMMTMGNFRERPGHFREHPCTRLFGKQADDDDYEGSSKYIFTVFDQLQELKKSSAIKVPHLSWGYSL